ncbi:RNA polymerase factor sigma-54 [Falsibacillus pallidus]|uniref:RNA polymerase factor sigma-54 n=1 Tax=Falsibacillus pallidus TaxID=493781 RepID=UPI003D980DB8
MNLKAGLWQQQSLKLNMTQELSQAIALLQYSTQELFSFLEQKVMENPLIGLESPDVQLMDPRSDRIRTNRIAQPNKTKQEWLERVAQKPDTLQEHLFSQLIMKTLTFKQKQILDLLLYNFDANGYLTASTDEIACEADAPVEEAEKLLTQIQSLDPAGVGARNLRECLLLQVKRREGAPQWTEEILMNHFQEFADRKWKDIASKLSCSLKEIQAVSDFIQTLTPRPAAEYGAHPSIYIIPELIVEVKDGQIRLRHHDSSVPHLIFHKEYYDEMEKYKDKGVKSFLKDKFQDYQFLMKSLHQRQETILKVGTALIELQTEFFLKGPKHLKPLTMKQLAEEIEVHESTVSRAVREKYIQTPFGTFELKSFFSSGVATNEDGDASSSTVKNLIQEWIDEEDKKSPISDQAIADRLKEEGLKVSRRTVAKYRDQLQIPASSKRKRFDE